MKFSTGAVLLGLCATAEAFAPSNVAAPKSSVQLQAARSDNNNNDNIHSKALSFLTAGALAVATSVVVPTVDFPQPTTPIVHVVGIPAANAADKRSQQPKLSKEEKERIEAKKNLDLSQQTLKEYQKYNSDLQSAFKKAESQRNTSVKQATDAKNAYLKINDKLSKAKNEKMPSSAIQELNAQVSKLKDALKEKEAAESVATKSANGLEKDLKSAQKALKDSENAIKKAKKRSQSAEKSYQQYLKKVAQQQKEKSKKEAEKKKKQDAALKKEQEKVKALEKAQSKLASQKEKDAKELKNKQKALKQELKQLEKMKTKSK